MSHACPVHAYYLAHAAHALAVVVVDRRGLACKRVREDVRGCARVVVERRRLTADGEQLATHQLVSHAPLGGLQPAGPLHLVRLQAWINRVTGLELQGCRLRVGGLQARLARSTSTAVTPVSRQGSSARAIYSRRASAS
eukprot:scaffold15590_cov61-Phaeocystis_antarctica.AAC.4